MWDDQRLKGSLKSLSKFESQDHTKKTASSTSLLPLKESLEKRILFLIFHIDQTTAIHQEIIFAVQKKHIKIVDRTNIPGVAIIKELPQQRQLAVVNDKPKKKHTEIIHSVFKPF